MRNASVILLMAIMILIGCKPKSKSSLEIKTDSTNSNKGLKMPDIGDLKNNPNNNNSNNSNNSNNTLNTSGSWSSDYRNRFVQDCIRKASESVSIPEATSYCNCMTQKVEAKYPNEKEVDASLTSADIQAMRPGCATNSNTQSDQSYNNNNNSNNYNTASWSTSDQQEFMSNCTPGASKSLGNAGAQSYCDCMMRKLMQAYPNSADVGNASKDQMSALAADCLRR